MSVLFFLIPIGLFFVGLAIWGFIWAVDNGQFEDLERQGHNILFDDDLAPPDAREEPAAPEPIEADPASTGRSA